MQCEVACSCTCARCAHGKLPRRKGLGAARFIMITWRLKNPSTFSITAIRCNETCLSFCFHVSCVLTLARGRTCIYTQRGVVWQYVPCMSNPAPDRPAAGLEHASTYLHRSRLRPPAATPSPAQDQQMVPAAVVQLFKSKRAIYVPYIYGPMELQQNGPTFAKGETLDHPESPLRSTAARNIQRLLLF